MPLRFFFHAQPLKGLTNKIKILLKIKQSLLFDVACSESHSLDLIAKKKKKYKKKNTNKLIKVKVVACLTLFNRCCWSFTDACHEFGICFGNHSQNLYCVKFEILSLEQ